MKKGILLVLILTVFIAICTFTACKDTSSDNVNDGGEHVHSLTSQVIPSTCTIQGRKTSTCECGYVVTEVLELDSENHQFGAWSVVTPSTCTTKGSQVRACTCGAQETGSLELDLNNHETNCSHSEGSDSPEIPGDNNPETPVDPEQPGTDPEDPVDPEEPEVPTDPETPVDPEQPGTDPEVPTDPEEPEVPTDPEVPEDPTHVDYVAELKLDNTSNTAKEEATVKSFIDGDTVIFTVPTTVVENGTMKVRLVGINAPESTGMIEDYGLAAAKFTKDALKNAVSIIIESDSDAWNTDSIGERYLVWVWYKTEAEGEYRNLNIELLQNGLANLVADETRYSEVATNAFNQAKAEKLNIHSGVEDPEVGGDNDDNVEEPALIIITKTMEEMATLLAWEDATKYLTFNLDEVITVTSVGGGNTGKYYDSDKTYRLYQTANSTLTIEAKEGYEIVSVKITYNYSNAGTLLLNEEAIESKSVVDVNDTSITFGVGSTSDATNGQAKIKAIEVVYQLA